MLLRTEAMRTAAAPTVVVANGHGANAGTGHISNEYFFGAKMTHDAETAWREAQGASQIGPFDYVPPMGFREYWYPALLKKDVGTKKPVCVKMLGEDIVFFRGKQDKIYALSDWCPHRSARLSQGESLFPGTITCEYHGYTFDGAGACVAGLIESADSPMMGKMKAKSYPTAEHQGIVYAWMGETEPVPLEDDLPPEIVDDRIHFYHNTAVWDANWDRAGEPRHGLSRGLPAPQDVQSLRRMESPSEIQVPRYHQQGLGVLPAPVGQLRGHQGRP